MKSLCSKLTQMIACFQGDLTQKEDVEQLFGNHQFDTVFHCASYGMSGREQVCVLRGGRSWFKPFLEEKTRIRQSTDKLNFVYLRWSRGFLLAGLVAFTKSFTWLVCHVVGLFTSCV